MNKIAITTGDPNGIGAEITIKALNKLNLPYDSVVLISNKKILDFYGERCHSELVSESNPLIANKYQIIEIPYDADIEPGKVTKKAGEFYTPQQVSKILAKIVTLGKTRLKNVYDPTCGSGSLLLRVSKEADVEDFYGQELNQTTYNLARMNMILHGVKYGDFDIKQGDSLEYPMHINKKFEAIVANPPFSLP